MLTSHDRVHLHRVSADGGFEPYCDEAGDDDGRSTSRNVMVAPRIVCLKCVARLRAELAVGAAASHHRQ